MRRESRFTLVGGLISVGPPTSANNLIKLAHPHEIELFVRGRFFWGRNILRPNFNQVSHVLFRKNLFKIVRDNAFDKRLKER